MAAAGQLSSGVLNGLNVPLSAGQGAVIGFTITAAGLTLANTVPGSASAGAPSPFGMSSASST